MAVSVNGIQAEVAYAATSAITLFEFSSRRGQSSGWTVYVFATTAGTLEVFYLDQNGVERSLQTQAVTASTLAVLNFQFGLPRARAKFIPSSQPGTVTAEGINYG
jgi:hypothetical protein